MTPTIPPIKQSIPKSKTSITLWTWDDLSNKIKRRPENSQNKVVNLEDHG